MRKSHVFKTFHPSLGVVKKEDASYAWDKFMRKQLDNIIHSNVRLYAWVVRVSILFYTRLRKSKLWYSKSKLGWTTQFHALLTHSCHLYLLLSLSTTLLAVRDILFLDSNGSESGRESNLTQTTKQTVTSDSCQLRNQLDPKSGKQKTNTMWGS